MDPIAILTSGVTDDNIDALRSCLTPDIQDRPEFVRLLASALPERLCPAARHTYVAILCDNVIRPAVHRTGGRYVTVQVVGTAARRIYNIMCETHLQLDTANKELRSQLFDKLSAEHALRARIAFLRRKLAAARLAASRRQVAKHRTRHPRTLLRRRNL